MYTGTGGASPFGAGGQPGSAGTGNSQGNVGGTPASSAYGAGGGGGGGDGGDFGFNNNPNGNDPRTGYLGEGGSAGATRTFTIDLTNSNNNANLAVNTGAAGNAGSGSRPGGAGARGTAASTGVTDGYVPFTLSDLSGSYAPVESRSGSGGYRTSNTNATQTFSALTGDTFTTTINTSSAFGHRLTMGGNAVIDSNTGLVTSPGNVTFTVSVSGTTNNAHAAAYSTIQWRPG